MALWLAAALLLGAESWLWLECKNGSCIEIQVTLGPDGGYVVQSDGYVYEEDWLVLDGGQR